MNEPLTADELAGIKWRAVRGILLNGVEDRRALLAEVDRLQAQLAVAWQQGWDAAQTEGHSGANPHE